MSPKNPLLTVGLTAMGLFVGYTAARAANPGDPPAPPGQPSPSAPSPSPTVLLLSDGRILRGTIAEDGNAYVVRQPGGEIRVRKDQVERAFESSAALYRYKVESVQDRDPDEQLKLARWCMIQKMPAEARKHLQAVVALSPGSSQARTMLASLESTEARARGNRPGVDSGLVKTGAEVTEPAPGDDGARPAEMDAAVLRRATREMRLSALPVIFDLPPAVAVQRAGEFARNVHVILQASCARCHNERYDGRFQLIEVKRRRDLTVDVMRANLDATLQLVDPQNPSRSELLSSTLIPHGNGSNPRPIFRGSNDPRFQILSAWVNSLRAARPTDNVVPTKFGAKDAPGNGFASERRQGTGNQPFVTTPSDTFGVKKTEIQQAPSRYVPGQGMVTEKTPPSSDEFPAPFSVGGPKPKPIGGVPAPARPTPPASPPGSGIPLPALPPGTPAGEPTAAPAKPKKPLKIDPQLLEKALQNRNAGR